MCSSEARHRCFLATGMRRTEHQRNAFIHVHDLRWFSSLSKLFLTDIKHNPFFRSRRNVVRGSACGCFNVRMCLWYVLLLQSLVSEGSHWLKNGKKTARERALGCLDKWTWHPQLSCDITTLGTGSARVIGQDRKTGWHQNLAWVSRPPLQSLSSFSFHLSYVIREKSRPCHLFPSFISCHITHNSLCFRVSHTHHLHAACRALCTAHTGKQDFIYPDMWPHSQADACL